MELNNDNVVHPPAMLVRPYVIDAVNEWRNAPPSEPRRLLLCREINQLEAIFAVGNLRSELPLEGLGNNPNQKTQLTLSGQQVEDDEEEGFSDEAIDVFGDFLQETPCHLISLHLNSLRHQHLRRLLQALHHNTSVKDLVIESVEENDGVLIEELLRNKTDFITLQFWFCYHFNASDAVTRLLSGLTQLKTLVFYSCRIGDEGVRLILQHTYPFLKDLHFRFNQLTGNGLGIMARRIPEALPSLETLVLEGNKDLLNNPENTQLFAKNVLPMLRELHINYCGDGTGYSQIITACEADTIGKLELLDISTRHPHQAVRNQLVESLPKMKVQHLICAHGLFTRSDRALMSALYKNTIIIALDYLDAQARRHHVAPILQRNKLLANITKEFVSGERTGTATTASPIADNTTTIITPLGRWSRALAEIGRERVRHGATLVYMILQAALASWNGP
jgi:hypothetical protein